MDRYIQINLLPDPEISQPVVMNHLFDKLHHALARVGQGEIGISFPNAHKHLGDIVRLHSNEQALQRLSNERWLNGLQDYIKVSDILTVPDHCQYRVVERVHVKSDPVRLYRRSVRKGWLTQEEAEKKAAQAKAKRLDLPFIQLKSQSTEQYFKLFINQGKLIDKPINGQFSAYGLSKQATIPWF